MLSINIIGELNTIEHNHDTTERRMSALYEKYSQKYTQAPNWPAIISAVRKLDKVTMADSLEAKFVKFHNGHAAFSQSCDQAPDTSMHSSVSSTSSLAMPISPLDSQKLKFDLGQQLPYGDAQVNIEPSLFSDFEALRGELCAIVVEAIALLQQCDLEKVACFITTYCRKHITADDVLNKIPLMVTIFDYNILQNLVKTFSSNELLLQRINAFKSDMESFKHSAKMKQLIDEVKTRHRELSDKDICITLHLEPCYIDVVFDDFEKLIKSIFKRHNIRNIQVSNGSLLVSWIVDSDGAESLVVASAKDPSFMFSIGIMLLTVGDMVLFDSEVHVSGRHQRDKPFSIESAFLEALESTNVKAAEVLLAIGGSSLLHLQASSAKTSIIAMKDHNGFTMLHFACQNGHSEAVAMLLEAGCDPNATTEKNETPLLFACENGHADVASILLEADADADITEVNELTPLTIAIQLGHYSVIKLLLSKRENPNAHIEESVATAINSALYGKYYYVILAFLEVGANPNIPMFDSWTFLMVASYNGYDYLVRALLAKQANVDAQNSEGTTPICFAIQNGHLSVVVALYNAGASLQISDHKGMTPLMIATNQQYECVEIIKFLLEKHVDVNARNRDGQTAMYITCAAGHKKIMSLLLDAGANPTIASNVGVTPLMAACQYGHSSIVDALCAYIKSKGNLEHINAQSAKGKTALYFACQYNEMSCVQLLLDAGADPNIADNHRRRPLSRASFEGNKDIVLALLASGAHPNHTDDEGYIPLLAASENGHTNVITELLNRSTDSINHQANNGTTALYIACQNAHDLVATNLLSKGADPNLARNDGWTPLVVASFKGCSDIVEHLIKHGAHINPPSGVSPIKQACKQGHVYIFNLLEAQGADTTSITKEERDLICKARATGLQLQSDSASSFSSGYGTGANSIDSISNINEITKVEQINSNI